jgi:hypothetical protein
MVEFLFVEQCGVGSNPISNPHFYNIILSLFKFILNKMKSLNEYGCTVIILILFVYIIIHFV